MKVSPFFLILFCFVLPVAGYGQQSVSSSSPPDQAARLTTLRNETNRLSKQIERYIPAKHLLYDYFRESVGIINRLHNIIQDDHKAGKQLDVGIQMKEAEFLAKFLNEELQVTRSNDQAKAQIIDVTAHGLKGDGQFNNELVLRKLIEECRRNKAPQKLVFPQGDYFFSNSPGRSSIELIGLDNLTFEGEGKVTLLFDGKSGSMNNLLIESSRNLAFKNLTIDNSPLPFTLGTIVAVNSGNEIEIDIVDAYPEPDSSYQEAVDIRGLLRNPKTGRIDLRGGDPRIKTLSRLSGKRYRLVLDDNTRSGNTKMTTNYKPGYYFSLHPRKRPNAANSITVFNSQHLLFDHINIHAGDSNLMGVYTSAGVKLLDCNIEPAPGRIIMSNADGLHCQSNKKGLYLERCRVMGMNDDCMNFYARLASVSEVINGTTFVLLVTHERNEKQGPYFKIGDPIAFMNANTGDFDAHSTIAAIDKVDWGGQKGLIRIKTTSPVSHIISRRSAGRPDSILRREYTPSGADNYRAAMAIKAPFEHMVLNLSAKNDGFIVRNCEMGYNRSSGFKCKATNGVIRNTHFHDNIVLFWAELSWHEGTFPRNLEVSDVVIDKGARFLGSLPGKMLEKEEVARFMPHLNFIRVTDAAGNKIVPPMEAR